MGTTAKARPARRSTQMQQVARIARGLHLTQNRAHLVEGALIEAENVFIDRDGVISKSRGFNRFGDVLAQTGATLGEFNDVLIVIDGTAFKFDSDGLGTFTTIAGSFAAPPNAVRIHFQEGLLALFFTSSTGIQRLPNLTGAVIRDAGFAQSLDSSFTFPTGVNWLEGTGTTDFQVAYRTVFGYIDENGQEVVGADSFRQIALNTTGADSDVQITTTIPDGVVAGDFLDIFRTSPQVLSTADPGETFFKVARVELVAADITAGVVVYLDQTEESFLDFAVQLITNSTSEGPAQEDSRPPFSNDISRFRGHTFFANIRREHEIEIRFVDTAGITTGVDTISVTDGTTTLTYNFEAAESIPAQNFELFTAGLIGQNVRNTMLSLVRVMNRDTTNSLFYAHYASGAEDAPGKILIRRRDYTDVALSLTATASAGAQFEPLLPLAGTSVSTDAGAVPNRLAFSKVEQPDSVPRSNFFDIGTTRNRILRILELRDSLIIWTERSIFRLSGEEQASFTVRLLDPSTRLRAVETAVVLNNAVFGYSSQGVVRVTENGVAVVSRRIEFELNRVLEIANFETLSFGIAYEEERQYWLCLPGDTTDTFPTLAWVYNYISEDSPWTQRLKAMSHGVVLKEGDRLFLAHAQDARVLKERKSFSDDQDDFVDEDIAVTVDVVSTTTDADGQTVSLIDITYTYANRNFDEGFLVFSIAPQPVCEGRVFSFVFLGGSSYRLTLDRLCAWATGAAFVSLNIPSRIQWAPETMGDASMQKQYSRVQVYFESERAIRHRLGFSSDLLPGTRFVSTITTASFGWGLGAWGTGLWGDEGDLPSVAIRAVVPRDLQRCRALSVFYRHQLAKASFAIDQMSIQARVVSERTVRTPR